jgi:hypothetical protein
LAEPGVLGELGAVVEGEGAAHGGGRAAKRASSFCATAVAVLLGKRSRLSRREVRSWVTSTYWP